MAGVFLATKLLCFVSQRIRVVALYGSGTRSFSKNRLGNNHETMICEFIIERFADYRLGGYYRLERCLQKLREFRRLAAT